jgi:hypothetical protein
MTKFTEQEVVLSAISETRAPEINQRLKTLGLLASNEAVSAANFSHLLAAPLFKGSIEYKNMSRALVYHFGLTVLKADIKDYMRHCLKKLNQLEAPGLKQAEREPARK